MCRGGGGADDRASLGQRQQARIQKGGMKIEFLPASARTITRGPCVRSLRIRELNGGCDFSWGSPGPHRPAIWSLQLKPHGG